MNQSDLNNLLQYASDHSLMDKSFQEAYQLWQQSIQDTIDSWLADEYLASAEFYDNDYLDTAV